TSAFAIEATRRIAHRRGGPDHPRVEGNRAGISVVIPALDEAGHIAGAIEAVRDGADEGIVVGGGSRDDTPAIARSAGARVCCARGASRATALNIGAALARGGIVYFVHADCRPRGSFAGDIRAAIRSGADAGCFRIRFESSHWLLRLSGWLSRIDVAAFPSPAPSPFVPPERLPSARGLDATT